MDDLTVEGLFGHRHQLDRLVQVRVEGGPDRGEPRDAVLLDAPQEPIADELDARCQGLAVLGNCWAVVGRRRQRQIELIDRLEQRQRHVSPLHLEHALPLALGPAAEVVLVLLKTAVGPQHLVEPRRLCFHRLAELIELALEHRLTGDFGGLGESAARGGTPEGIGGSVWVSDMVFLDGEGKQALRQVQPMEFSAYPPTWPWASIVNDTPPGVGAPDVSSYC